MDSDQTEQELTQKSDHELLVLLVSELRSIRQALEAGYEYSIKMDESRSGAWGAKYSGSGSVESRLPKKLHPNGFAVYLMSAGTQKIAVINAIREVLPGLGQKEAKDLVENPGRRMMDGVSSNAAEKVRSKLEALGATVELK